ncbi:hypothetical protein D3C85_517110 [compost metagenome]
MSKQKPVFDHLVMSIEEKRKLLDSAKGKFFSIDFVKSTGELRHMVCKKWMQKYLHGKPGENKNSVSHIPKYYTVAEEASQGYRNINLETVKRVVINGKIYEFEDKQ